MERTRRKEIGTELRALLFVADHYGNVKSTPLRRNVAAAIAKRLLADRFLSSISEVMPVLDPKLANKSGPPHSSAKREAVRPIGTNAREMMAQFFVSTGNAPATRNEMASVMPNVRMKTFYMVTTVRKSSADFVRSDSPCGNRQKTKWSLTESAYALAKRLYPDFIHVEDQIPKAPNPFTERSTHVGD